MINIKTLCPDCAKDDVCGIKQDVEMAVGRYSDYNDLSVDIACIHYLRKSNYIEPTFRSELCSD